MNITSPVFDPNGPIPEKYTQHGENHSPPLDFKEIPEGTHSLALIMDDPDAPNGTFTHWVVFNIEKTLGGFKENHVPIGVRLACNDYGEAKYAGPKPPDGEHRYVFHLYAVDSLLEVPEGSSRQAVEEALEGHVLAETELIGRFATPVSASD